MSNQSNTGGGLQCECESYPDHLGVGHGGGGGLLGGLDHTNRVGAGIRDGRSREPNDRTPHEPARQVIILRQVLVQEVVLQQQHSSGEAVSWQASAAKCGQCQLLSASVVGPRHPQACLGAVVQKLGPC